MSTPANRASFMHRTGSHASAVRDTPGATLFDTAIWVFTALIALIALILGVDWLVRADTFPVRAVRFEGEFKRVTQAELESVVMDAVRGSFLRLDLDAVQERARRLPWIQSVSVRRGWPRDVYVQFSEQKLLARWNGDAWVNQALQAVQVPGGDVAGLPMLEGPEGTEAQVYQRYQELNTQFSPAGLTLTRLTLTPRRTWRLEFNSGLALILDRDAPPQKLERFLKAWPALAREGRAIQQVDLRYTNGFAVLWANRSSH
jgi:cell division protein FtsQ